MATHKQSWFPHAKHIAIVPRGVVPYSHSLWVGLTSPILNFPLMVFEVMIVPFVSGFFSIVMISGIALVAGISGRALGYEEKPVNTDDTPKAG